MSFASDSVGTQVNRYLDRLGLPESFGDSIGALVDARRGDIGGAIRNLFDLQSGLSTRSLDQAIGSGVGQAFGRGFIPRCSCGGPHLGTWGNTYAVSRQVGHQAYIGQKYNYNVGPFQCQGRITGRQYCGSFSKPIHLNDNQWLFHGRTYTSLNDVARDIRDGRVDGNATTQYRCPTSFMPFVPYCPTFPAGGAPIFPFNPLAAVTGGLQNVLQNAPNLSDILNNIIGNAANGVAQGGNGAGSSNGASNGATTDTGAAGASDIMSGPGSLEDKLLLLMAKLADHLDKQIEDQMKKIESEMAKQKQDGKGGSSSGGGILGSIAGVAGGVFGGPIGAIAGNAIGSALGGSSGGSNGSSSSSGGDKSNLQLLQSQLQQMVERRNQMFQTMTQMLKSLNDTSLSIIRNLKA